MGVRAAGDLLGSPRGAEGSGNQLARILDCGALLCAAGGRRADGRFVGRDGAVLDFSVSTFADSGGAGTFDVAALCAIGGAGVFMADDGNVVTEYGFCVNWVDFGNVVYMLQRNEWIQLRNRYGFTAARMDVCRINNGWMLFAIIERSRKCRLASTDRSWEIWKMHAPWARW